MIEPLRLDFLVACPVDHAFDVYARRTGLWWPKTHSFSGDPELTVHIEPHVGGRIYERTSDGVEHDWGEVTAWDPPHGLSYLWHIATDRSRATHVAIEFLPDGDDATRVRILHTGWDALGDGAQDWRDRNHQGWAGVTGPYVEAAQRT
jgi:uncharacterized protein YndB with AHSA1/START domain